MPPPESIEGRFSAALAAHQQGRLQEAERYYLDVLARAPRHSPAHNNLGLTFAMRGRMREAIACFRAALDSDPASADAALNLARALEQCGDLSAALAAWRDATTLAPADMEPALGAALLAARTGHTREADELVETAAWRSARRRETQALLLTLACERVAGLIHRGDMARAHRLAARLVVLEPGDRTAMTLLARCLRVVRVDRFDAGLKRDLLACFASETVDHRELSRVAADVLRLEHPELACSGRPLCAAMAANGVHRDPLLLGLLWRGVNTDPVLEAVLTQLRGELVAAVDAGEALDSGWRAFLAALAGQCFANEYLFEPPADGGREARLWARAAAKATDWEAFAALTTLEAPWRREGADALTAHAASAPEWVRELVQRVLLEPLEEQQLRGDLDAEPVVDGVSQAVQRQYEESPYPRWRTLERQPAGSVAAMLGDVLPDYSPAAALDGPVDILVAGCGTGEHALRVAARHPECRVDAIDLSMASLAYAARKARALGIGNVRLCQRDILALGSSSGPYHLIESVGVLHHMANPAAGLAALVRRMAPGGVIKIGLYSRSARAQVNRARARIDELGLAATPEGIRGLRRRILDGEEPDLEPLTASRDFYTLSAVRDLLFHVQEHQYDVAQLGALLKRCGLRLIGFQVLADVRRHYLQCFPGDPALANLDHWQTFEAENPYAFGGMYQCWCEIGEVRSA